MIYAMQPIEGGAVKIGCSENVEARHKQLEAHYGQPLALLAVFDGDRETEHEIHKRFAHLRYGRTEQFRPAPDLMEFLGRPLLVSPNPESVEAMPVVCLPNVVSMRGRPEWRDWLSRLSKHVRGTPSATIDRALAELARREGFEDPPPRT